MEFVIRTLIEISPTAFPWQLRMGLRSQGDPLPTGPKWWWGRW